MAKMHAVRKACRWYSEALGIPFFQGSMDHNTQYEQHGNSAAVVSSVGSAVQPTYHVQVAATTSAARAYKRPMPPTPRKLVPTTAAAYSPRSTPPCKIPALQRVITHTKSGTIIMADLAPGEAPLTPPPTPEVSGM